MAQTPPGLGGGQCATPSYVPAAYRQAVCNAASQLGIPVSVVAAQWQLESGFNPGATSSSDAQGLTQFLPSTFAGLGCPGSPYNAADSEACYVKYMRQLLGTYHNNVADALAAYNCGQANCPAGQQYAATILKNAAQPGSLVGTGSTAGGGGGGAAAAGNISGVCLLGFTSSGIGGTSWINDIIGTGGNIGQGQLCLLRKSQARALIAGALLLPVGLVAVAGAAILALQTISRPLGGAGRALGGGAEIAGAALAVAGLPEAGAPIAAAGSGLRHASRGSQGRAGKYAARKKTQARQNRSEDTSLAGRGASNVKTAVRRQPASGPSKRPTHPGRKTGTIPGPRDAPDSLPPRGTGGARGSRVPGTRTRATQATPSASEAGF